MIITSARNNRLLRGHMAVGDRTMCGHDVASLHVLLDADVADDEYKRYVRQNGALPCMKCIEARERRRNEQRRESLPPLGDIGVRG